MHHFTLYRHSTIPFCIAVDSIVKGCRDPFRVLVRVMCLGGTAIQSTFSTIECILLCTKTKT